MTTILALDTSSNACSVALSFNGRHFSLFELTPRGHMQRLLPMVDELLAQAECRLRDLTAIAFCRGPGSFTGLRVASGVVQGLAFGAQVPVIPLSSLAALAEGFRRRHPNARGHLAVAVDARMDEVYGARFDITADGCQLQGQEWLLPAGEPALAALAGADYACGSGWGLAAMAAAQPAHAEPDCEPDALDLLTLAQHKGVELLPAHAANPVYLRDSVSWQKRQRIRTATL